MLFNSYEFLFGFLPLCVLGFFLLARRNPRLAASWLVLASLFFYGWWNPRFVLLLVASIAGNFLLGREIAAAPGSREARRLLGIAIVANLSLLAVFKYANFFIQEFDRLGAGLPMLDIVLPAGISFFTFTQIAYLVDAYRNEAREYDPVHYALFVSWFPHLIAGPVLHHKQMMPQFSQASTYRPNAQSVATGLTLFTFGLAKKVLLADQFALYATPLFESADGGASPQFFSAWAGALAYALQLYFDFSGYSDMAVGLSRIFNVRLPLNFDSPYKAASIIDFWRRWHMTLSAFLRDYLYFALGGNRHGRARRYANLMATMVLGGLWHGAGWGFVLWGTLHGLFLVVNHLWRSVSGDRGTEASRSRHAASVALTFAVVVAAWVPFRAETLAGAWSILRGMAGLNGISVPAALAPGIDAIAGVPLRHKGLLAGLSHSASEVVPWLVAGLAIVWLLPNSQQLLARYAPAWDEVRPRGIQWVFSWRTGAAAGALLGVCLLFINRSSEFLYFQF